MLMISIFTYAQKKTNGTVYIDHPAITVVEAMTKAYVSGDSTKVASYLTCPCTVYLLLIKTIK